MGLIVPTHSPGPHFGVHHSLHQQDHWMLVSSFPQPWPAWPWAPPSQDHPQANILAWPWPIPVTREVPCSLAGAVRQTLAARPSRGFPMTHGPQDALSSCDAMLHTIQLSFCLQLKTPNSYVESSSFHHKSKYVG